LENLLVKFWTIEEVAINKPKSEEETECEAHFTKTVSHDDDGRYTVRLPFRNTNKRLGESRTIALKRLSSLERKLNADIALKTEYDKILEKYLSLNHMSPLEDSSDGGYYMPHHAVIKE